MEEERGRQRWELSKPVGGPQSPTVLVERGHYIPFLLPTSPGTPLGSALRVCESADSKMRATWGHFP